jgi:hypothetical protein
MNIYGVEGLNNFLTCASCHSGFRDRCSEPLHKSEQGLIYSGFYSILEWLNIHYKYGGKEQCIENGHTSDAIMDRRRSRRNRGPCCAKVKTSWQQSTRVARCMKCNSIHKVLKCLKAIYQQGIISVYPHCNLCIAIVIQRSPLQLIFWVGGMWNKTVRGIHRVSSKLIGKSMLKSGYENSSI